MTILFLQLTNQIIKLIYYFIIVTPTEKKIDVLNVQICNTSISVKVLVYF
jgi:hypothetical protein